MIGLGYELGSRKDTPFGLRGVLMDTEGRSGFWANLSTYVQQGVRHIVLHRLYGEPTPNDFFDYDTRYQIRKSGDPDLIAYEREMTAGLITFAKTYPDVQIDLYFGSLRQGRMYQLKFDDPREWFRRFWYELAIARKLINNGCNIRMVFDHSASYEPESAEWMAISHLSRMYPNRVVVESIPELYTPQRRLPAFVFDSRYQILARIRPDQADYSPLTRMTHFTDPDTVVEFVEDCRAKGQTPVISDTILRRSGLTIQQISQQAGIDDPQGVE